MTGYTCIKTARKGPSGIRQTEIRLTHRMDAMGQIKLVRLVGKSFLETPYVPVNTVNTAKSADISRDKNITGPKRSA